MNVLVDSTLLIDVLRNRNDRPALLGRLIAQGRVLCACDITLAEVYAGMRDSERTATEELLESLYYVPSEPSVARRAGLLRRDWARKGTTLTLTDTFLAALAMQHGLALLTDNRKHFPMKEIVVWTPADAPLA